MLSLSWLTRLTVKEAKVTQVSLVGSSVYVQPLILPSLGRNWRLFGPQCAKAGTSQGQWPEMSRHLA